MPYLEVDSYEGLNTVSASTEVRIHCGLDERVKARVVPQLRYVELDVAVELPTIGSLFRVKIGSPPACIKVAACQFPGCGGHSKADEVIVDGVARGFGHRHQTDLPFDIKRQILLRFGEFQP